MAKETKKASRTEPVSQSIRIPIRISGNVTSVSIRKSTAALWVLLNEEGTAQEAQQYDESFDSYKTELTDFAYTCLDTWEAETAKGFSDHVTELMIKAILEPSDFKEYKEILSVL